MGSDYKNLSITIERTGYKMQSSTKSRMDDLLSAEVGKHDYDWLLTPPETPLCPFSDAGNIQTTKAATSSKANARSVSTGKASRLSLSQSERESSAKPTRSSSTSRSAVSSTLSSSTYLSNSTRTAILNTSTASVTSKALNPGYRSASRSRPSTPSKTPVTPPKQLQNTMPCTPAARPNSRPSTPIHRGTTAASLPAMTRSASVSHAPAANHRSNGASNRPSSPAPRGRAKTPTPASPQQGTASTARTGSNSPSVAPVSSSIRKQSSSPIVARGRHQDNSPSAHSSDKSKEGKAVANKEEKPTAEESAGRRPIKHLLAEIKQSMGGLRGTSLFPQSIRSAVQRSRSNGSPELPIPGPEEVTHRHGNGGA
ncbi:sialidase-like isoform X1 [Zingiber officinale]|uniref:sialidase-like isoform X1 n=1 Tax=Zingiber officinale TaxID=94328 RepID=UPI001C4A7F77|nr:sialidase-like isoform X1 [Zingiber officinale]